MIEIEQALPLFVFIVVSFLAFYFIETILLLALNFYIKKYWKFVVDTLLRTIVRHRTMVRIVVFATLSTIIILLFLFTPLADSLVAGAATGVFRFLAIILVTTMLMIYYIGSKSMKDVVIAKRIHLFVFSVFSLLAFTGIMSAAQGSYEVYEDIVNQVVVEPIVDEIEGDYEKRLEDRLLDIFHEKIKNEECEYYDYAELSGSGITHFVFMKDDPALAEKDPEIRVKGTPLAGKQCVHETKFLLTPDGKWYEVLVQRFK